MKRLANFQEVETTDDKGKTKIVRVPYDVDEIARSLIIHIKSKGYALASINGAILFGDMDGDITYIDDQNALYSFLARCGLTMHWANSTGCVTKIEFFSYLKQTLTKYTTISKLPHWPKIDGVYYACEFPEPKVTGRLRELVDHWHYNSPIDKDLALAAFVTPFWGGEPGARPGFTIESSSADHGRGVGKTQFSEAMGMLSGGYFDIGVKMDIDTVKKRVLDAKDERIIRFDNIKAAKLSSEGIESLITARDISGHKMYMGHDKRPNLFTYLFTLNDASLSTDMAERCIRIILERKPRESNSIDWVPFVKLYRDEIIQEIAAFLTNEIPKADPSGFRFTSWFSEVMSKISANPDILTRIEQRQGEVDSDWEEAYDFRDFIKAKITRCRQRVPMSERGETEPCTPDDCNYLIERHLGSIWYRQFKGLPHLNDKTCSMRIKQMRMLASHRTGAQRYWVWLAPDKAHTLKGGYTISREMEHAGEWKAISSAVMEKLVTHFEDPDDNVIPMQKRPKNDGKGGKNQ